MAEENRDTYLQPLLRIFAHPGVATAFADGALKHRAFEMEFNRRVRLGFPKLEALSFPHMDLGPIDYWQRNFFSVLFLSIFDAIGISPARQIMHGMILHAVRGIVTATDNILDDEGKGAVRLNFGDGSKVLPNVLITLVENNVLNDVLFELCGDGEVFQRSRRALMSALVALGQEESSEEHAIEEVFSPERVLDEVHRFRGGGLLSLAFIVPELTEPALARRICEAREGVHQIGLALQIIDDLTDFDEDLTKRNHNMLRSWIVWKQPDGAMTDAELKALSPAARQAPEVHFERATRQVMEVAIDTALDGFARLQALGHPVQRAAAVDIMAAMFRLRGVERLWSLYTEKRSRAAS